MAVSAWLGLSNLSEQGGSRPLQPKKQGQKFRHAFAAFATSQNGIEELSSEAAPQRVCATPISRQAGSRDVRVLACGTAIRTYSRRPGVPCCQGTCSAQAAAKVPRTEHPSDEIQVSVRCPSRYITQKPVLIGGVSPLPTVRIRIGRALTRNCCLFVTCQCSYILTDFTVHDGKGFVSDVHLHTAAAVLKITHAADRRVIREVDRSTDAVRMWLAVLDQEEQSTV
jgi:hypothetical protein